jgi:hypothetical protein
MQWLLPAAFAGLLLAGLPLLIHLLGRERPPSQRVPTLRFIGETALAPVRRARLQDPLLMLLRTLLLVLAVLALARPSGQVEPAVLGSETAEPADVPAVPVTLGPPSAGNDAPRVALPQVRVLSALAREPAVGAALRASVADTIAPVTGVPVIRDAAGRALLGAWSDGSDTLRLSTAVALDDAAAQVLRRAVDDAAAAVSGTTAPASVTEALGADTSAQVTAPLRAGRDVHQDRSPVARLLWGAVLLLLLGEQLLRARTSARAVERGAA